MTLPAPVPGGLLAGVLDTWRTRGWDPADLARFRMGPDDDDGGDDDGDELDGLSDDDATALKSLSADDVKRLRGLKPEELAALKPDTPDPRIRQAREESAARRRELKPWKDLGKELGMSPDEIREALKGKKKKTTDDGGGGKGGDDAPDADAIRRKASIEAETAANRRVVRAEVKVLARDLFADPDDAPKYVDLDKYDVDDDGDLESPDALLEDLKEVLKRKPHLAKKPKKPKPDRAQGQRGSPASGADAGRAEAERRFGKAKATAGTS